MSAQSLPEIHSGSMVFATAATYSLAQRAALANGNLVTLLDTESGGDVGGEVLVALLVTGVLGNEVEVLAADDDGAVHLGGHNGAGQDTTADGDETGEGALLICRVKHGQRLHPSSSLILSTRAPSITILQESMSSLSVTDLDRGVVGPPRRNNWLRIVN